MNLVVIAHVLTCLVAVHFLSVQGQSTCCPTDSCCDNSCTPPTPYNISFEEVIGLQPLFVTFLPNIPLFAGVDNSCYTFIPLPDGTYLLTVSTVYTNGLNTIETYIFIPNGPGKGIYGSATCNIDITFFELITESETCSSLVFYQCFDYGECSMQAGNDVPVFGLSPFCEPLDEYCLGAIEGLISISGVPGQQYFLLPMQLEPQCVTSINCTIQSD